MVDELTEPDMEEDVVDMDNLTEQESLDTIDDDEDDPVDDPIDEEDE